MFHDWDTLDVGSLNHLEYFDYLHMFSLDRAIRKLEESDEEQELFDVELVSNSSPYQTQEDPCSALQEDWHKLRKIIHQEVFWPSIDDLLIHIPDWSLCNVCSEVYKRPVRWEPCGHTFCKKCVQTFTDFGHVDCPLCRCSLPDNLSVEDLKLDEYMVKRIGKIQAKCRWSVKWKKVKPIKRSLTGSLGSQSVLSDDSPAIKSFDDFMMNHVKREWVEDENGCQHVVELGSIVQHHLECKYKPVSCENEGCKVSVPYFKLDDHSQICLFSEIECRECHDRYLRINESQHQKECKMGVTDCNFCHAHIERKDIRRHISQECLLKPIHCPHHGLGCSCECPREDMETHLKQCPYEALKGFISSTLKKIDACEKKIRAQQEVISRLEWTIESHQLDRGNIGHGLNPQYDDDYY